MEAEEGFKASATVRPCGDPFGNNSGFFFFFLRNTTLLLKDQDTPLVRKEKKERPCLA